MKPVAKLNVSDLHTHRVWEYATDLEDSLPDETYVRPVLDLPVNSLDNRIVGTQLMLADGAQVEAILSNIDLNDCYRTEHFITVTVFDRRGRRFDLARYHDIDIENRGPEACSRFLGKAIDAVFPMKYDVSDVAIGVPTAVRRSIPFKPRSPLTREEIITLAVG